MDTQKKVLTAAECEAKYGEPNPFMERNHMALWYVPEDVAKVIHVIPQKIYCNKDMVIPLLNAFRNIIKRNLVAELKTWDGCFNIRAQRGYKTPSLHSWGVAVDINAAWNQLNMEPQLTPAFVKCFTDAGFDWGGSWQRKDGMHFQLAKI